MMRAALLALLLAGCNAIDRPQVISQPNDDDEVVALPGGGALILRRLAAATEPKCLVRARGFRGLVPMDCRLAETVRP
jgi:hypothetical protein